MPVNPRCDSRTHQKRTPHIGIRSRCAHRSDQRLTGDSVQWRPHLVSSVDTEVLAVNPGDLGGKLAVTNRTGRQDTVSLTRRCSERTVTLYRLARLRNDADAHRCMQSPPPAVELGREESRRGLQDLVRSSKLQFYRSRSANRYRSSVDNPTRPPDSISH